MLLTPTPHSKQCVCYNDQPINAVQGDNRCSRLAPTINTPCGQKADLHTVTALFWVITQWHLKMGPTDFPETSARNCHFTLRNDPKELSAHLLRVGSPKSSRHSYLQAMAATELHTARDCSCLTVQSVCQAVPTAADLQTASSSGCDMNC